VRHRYFLSFQLVLVFFMFNLFVGIMSDCWADSLEEIDSSDMDLWVHFSNKVMSFFGLGNTRTVQSLEADVLAGSRPATATGTAGKGGAPGAAEQGDGAEGAEGVEGVEGGGVPGRAGAKFDTTADDILEALAFIEARFDRVREEMPFFNLGAADAKASAGAAAAANAQGK